MGGVKQLEIVLSLTLLVLCLLPASLSESTTSNITLPGCPDKCGSISIPYPFGVQPGCFRDGFDLTCDESTTPPKLFIGSQSRTDNQLTDINITAGEARAYNVMFYACYKDREMAYNNTNNQWINLTFSRTYLFSNQRNKFTAIGCYILAYIGGQSEKKHSYWSACASFCASLNITTGDNGTCDGLGCCQTSIPGGLNYYGVQWGYSHNDASDYNRCNYAMLVEEDWYKFRVQQLTGLDFYEQNKEGVPSVLDWAIRDQGAKCQDGVEINSTNPACVSKNSTCYNTTNGEGYLCQCKPGYQGNPYLNDGCKGNYH